MLRRPKKKRFHASNVTRKIVKDRLNNSWSFMAGGSTAGKYRLIGTYMSLQTHKGRQTRSDHSLSRIQRPECSANVRGIKTYGML